MSVAALIRKMAEAGAPPEAIALAVEALEEAGAQVEAQRASARERKRRQREREAVTVTGQSRDESVTVTPTPPPPSFPPEPPKSPTPTRECISTREERDREEAGWVRFWTEYPRKVSKAEARKAFAKAWRKLPPFDEVGILTGGLERAKAAWVDAQFIPHAATWLNGERWTDEPSTVIPMKPRHERPDPDAKLAARHANYARAWEGSERAARYDWKP